MPGAWRQIWREDLLCSFIEMATSRFVNVSNEDISQFLAENENKNTARKTSQEVALFETFLRERKLNDPEELTPLQLDAPLRQFIVSVRKQDGSDYEPSLLQCMVASIERYLKKKSYDFSVINSIEFAGTQEVLKTKQKALKSSGKGNKPNVSRSLTDSEEDELYRKGQLGGESPEAMLNTLRFNNTAHLGMRGIMNMLIRAGHVVRASVVFALVRLLHLPTWILGLWEIRCRVRDWSSPVCRIGVDTTIPTPGSPAFLFHLRQYRTTRASFTDNGDNEPLLHGVASDSCLVIRANPVHVSRSSEANAGVHITPIRPRHSSAYFKATWYLNLIPVPRAINQPFTLIVPLHVVASHFPLKQGTTRISVQLRVRQQQSISTRQFLNNGSTGHSSCAV